MSKRLQVLFELKEYKTLQQLAREAGLSLGEWVRQTLRRATEGSSLKSPQEKLKNIRRFSKMNGPTGDIGQVLKEIESGYLG
jgi:hypothetical protein